MRLINVHGTPHAWGGLHLIKIFRRVTTVCPIADSGTDPLAAPADDLIGLGINHSLTESLEHPGPERGGTGQPGRQPQGEVGGVAPAGFSLSSLTPVSLAAVESVFWPCGVIQPVSSLFVGPAGNRVALGDGNALVRT
jgi:hypothetical protein